MKIGIFEFYKKKSLKISGDKFCVLTMKQYSPKSPADALDSSELDPCIAAENRLKKNVLSTKYEFF